MNAPVLNLDPECLINPVRLDLATIEAMMLWPNDPASRQLWWRAAALEEGLPRVDDMPVDLLREYAKDAMTIPRVAELNRTNAKRMVYGIVIGAITLEATYYAKHDPQRAALYKIQEELCKRLLGTYQIQPQTMKNKDGPIAPLRPAAHLWAAYIHRISQGGDVFPCRMSEIGAFIATAEEIRRTAESRRAPKARNPIMKAGESILIPESLASRLPAVSFQGTL